MTDIVVIPMLPNTSKQVFWSEYLKRNHLDDFGFADAGIATWKRWCSRNNVLLMIARELPLPEKCGWPAGQIATLLDFPPTIQRWLLPPFLMDQYGPGTSIAMIDADTIINPRSPSIFKQQSSDLLLTKDRKEWTDWKNNSCSAFAPLFPDVELDKSLYFNAGVMVHRTPLLAISFINFVLENHDELLGKLNGKVGTDQTPLNFMLQRLQKTKNLSISWLDSRWNARVDIALKEATRDQAQWPELAPRVVAGNCISHFIQTKHLMVSTEKFFSESV